MAVFTFNLKGKWIGYYWNYRDFIRIMWCAKAPDCKIRESWGSNEQNLSRTIKTTPKRFQHISHIVLQAV